MKLTKSSAVDHPEGWHLFKIVGEEEVEGKYGIQIKWKMRSAVRSEDTGEPIELVYYTRGVLSTHEKCKLTQLFIACGVIASSDEIYDLGEDIDSGILMGKVFEGRVDEPATEGGFRNIGAVRPKKSNKHKVEAETSKHKVNPKKEEADEDPFSDE